jgi:hypothetical protein
LCPDTAPPSQHNSVPPSHCEGTHFEKYKRQTLQPRQYDSLLLLVFSFAVGITYFARLIALEEQDLAQTFIGIDPRR